MKTKSELLSRRSGASILHIVVFIGTRNMSLIELLHYFVRARKCMFR